MEREADMEYVVVLITAPDEETAAGMARAVVEDGLAACVNIVPGLRSIYRWKGKVEDENEVLMVAKTQKDKFEALEVRIRELHPYEVPEVISIPITAGSEPYLAWLAESVS
jgi:periplasmic divalent cation tolerance protein